MTDSGFEAKPKSLDSSVSEFARERSDYYSREFAKIQGQSSFAWSWNWSAALLGPLWGSVRGAWGFFWIFLVGELFALVQIGRGLWGELGGDQIARLEKLNANICLLYTSDAADE